MKLVFLAALVVILVATLSQRALADTEYCPARITELNARSMPSSAYVYHVQALGKRTVDVNMIADTDRGWFSWSANAVPLLGVFSIAGGAGFEQAESAPMWVTFAQPVRVVRAWVVSASATGDKNFGWDKDGTVECDVPDFSDAYSLDESIGRPALSATPSPASSVRAVAAEAPFPPATCAHPFEPVRLRVAIDPRFPSSVHFGDYGGRADVRLGLAVDEFGELTDAWFLTSSGLQAFDESTLLAARQSTYVPAVSYCRQVKGFFVFRATFSARGLH
ncbi:MAG: hypothetical protein JO199_13850 [Candidatus Eremiobacteraeota bacterium]|nr:hypothetical protein [Candidatus Eremiobacteraeota bacterium]